MKQMISSGAKILYNYIMALVIFVIFLYPFISLAGEKLYELLPVYCIIVFLLLFYLIYSDMKALAKKEKKPQYGLNPYAIKGLVYGLIGIVPISVIVLVASLIKLNNDVAERIKHLAINTLLGPMYFVIRWLNESPAGYMAAVLLLPVIAMLGYLAGYFNIDIMKKLFKKKETIQEKGFVKSPWNPSLAENKNSGKKKKKKKTNLGGQ